MMLNRATYDGAVLLKWIWVWPSKKMLLSRSMSEKTAGVNGPRDGWDPVQEWAAVDRRDDGDEAEPVIDLGPSPLADAIAALEGLDQALVAMGRELERSAGR